MKKRILALWLVAVVLVGLMSVGCSAPSGDFSQAKKDYPLTVNGVTLEKSPSRVVVLSPALADVIVALGSEFEMKLVGRGSTCTQASIASLPMCGTAQRPVVTAILSVQADLVLTDREIPEETARELQEEGIPLLILPEASDRITLQKLYEDMGAALLGAKTGYPRGKNRVERLLMDLDDITRRIPEEERSVRAGFVLDDAGRMADAGTLGGLLLEYAGAINIAAEAGEEPLSQAQLIAADPQVLFCAEGKKDAILAQERYQSLQMTVVELPLSYMEWQGETVVEATRAMAQALYPQYFTTEN